MKGSGFPLNMVLDFGKSSVYTFRLSTTAIKKPLREWSARQFHLLLPKDLASRLKCTIVKLFIDFGIDYFFSLCYTEMRKIINFTAEVLI